VVISIGIMHAETSSGITKVAAAEVPARSIATCIVTQLVAENAEASANAGVDLDALRSRVYQSLSSLHSGAFRGEWREHLESPLVGQSYSFTCQIRGMFNEPAGCYAIKSAKWAPDLGGKQFRAINFAVVTTPEATIRYGESNRVMLIRDAADPAKNSPHPKGEFIDPRLFGVATTGRLLRGDKLDEKHVRSLLQGDPTLVDREESGLLRIEWESEHEQKTVWIEEHGVVALIKQMVRRERYPDVDDGLWSPPLNTHTIAWEQVDGIYVPVSFSLKRLKEELVDGVIPSSREERKYSTLAITVLIEWSRINADIVPAEFSESWIEVADGTVVTDERGPHGVKHRVIGSVAGGRIARSDNTEVRARNGSAWIFIVANVLALVGGLAVWLLRRKKRRPGGQ
jgi:hypothetical protein